MSLPVRSRAIAAIVGLAAVVGACDPGGTTPSPTAAPAASATVDPAAPTKAILLGTWRPRPVPVDEDLLDAVASVCRNPGDEDVKAAIENLPVVVADARGQALVSVILADDHVAFECRVRLEDVGGTLGATIIEQPSRLVPDATMPEEEDHVRVISHSRVDEEGGSRTILIGRVGPTAFASGVGFNDETEVDATQANGWFLAWWPGTKEPGVIVSVDRRNVVLSGAPDPAKLIEGRVGPASWWLDPAFSPLPPANTTIPALIQERACTSGQSPEGRVVPPAVFSSEDAVLVTFWVRRLAGDSFDCQGTPGFPVEITLTEPIGDRGLLDGSTIPPRDASVAP